jgi:predicted ATPase/DNA-binding SARP family transcriptional activator
MRLTLELMGPPTVRLDDAPVKFNRRAELALLAYLAISDRNNSKQRYRRELLSALFWPEYSQKNALGSLRHLLWEISRSIGERWLIAEHDIVCLKPDADITLDVTRFHSLLREAVQQSNVALRIPLLEEAVKLYRGPFMAGFTLQGATDFNEWVSLEAEDLRRAMISVLTMLTDDNSTMNQAKSALPYAQRLVVLDPLNEGTYRQLMKLYVATGQIPAALQTYQKLEKLLRKELNVDPQLETREFYRKIRKGELEISDNKKEPEVSAPKHNLPLQLTSFVGREKEKGEISKLIAQNRLVTLIGTGGIGKTRLALQVGQSLISHYPDGVWFISLDSLTDEELAPQRVASSFGIIESPGQSIVDTLMSTLRNRIMLLILDSLEHLLEACAPLIEALLKNCPNVKILTTSRVVLGLEGECVYSVPSLTSPASSELQWTDSIPEYEALRLFIERSRLVSPSFEITRESFCIVSEICSHLDGIPLAIEFAAARVDILRVEEILKQLNQSFELLAGSKRSLPPRHQTLRASIQWSWDLMTNSEQRFMRRLSVFAGGWTRDAAQSVCECENLELIGALVRKSLILVDREAGHETRYRFHNMVRKYALERLLEAGEENTIHDRHLEYFLEMSRKFEPALRGMDQLLWLERLFVDRDNIRAAIQWAAKTNVQAGLYLSGRLQAFWESYDLPEEKRWLLMI